MNRSHSKIRILFLTLPLLLGFSSLSAQEASLGSIFNEKPDSRDPLLARAVPANGKLGDYLELDFDRIVNLQVTSVSKRSERLFDAPAAISVISAEDIERSGLRSIPELLRLAPGLEVAQINAHTWSVASRGFGGRFSNKLLTLMDGRTIYAPYFAGTVWDMQDYLLADLDRIEVVRGPGATLWGANAVNGVINIISKDSAETQGFYTEAGYGTSTAFEGFRYGGKVNDQLTWRVYEKYYNNNSFTALRDNNFDDYRYNQGGFRMDWKPSTTDQVTWSGDLYAGNGGTRQLAPSNSLADLHLGGDGFAPFTLSRYVTDEYHASGGNILGKWQHQFEIDNQISLQAYYDRTYRNEYFYTESRDTIDLEFQHQITPAEGHQVVWGMGTRGTFDKIENSDTTGGSTTETIGAPRRANLLVNAFVQDTMTVIPDRLFFTPGTKIERNDYTGVEVEPSGRLLWTPEEHHSVWTSVSRAVRTPSRAENDATVTVLNSAAGPVVLLPNQDLKSEEILAYELGYRVQATPHLLCDITGFYNQYRNIISQPTITTLPGQSATLQQSNNLHGSSYGTELAGSWQATDRWQLSASYSWLRTAIAASANSAANEHVLEKESPEQQVKLNSRLDLPQHISLDNTLFWIDQIEVLDLTQTTETYTPVPSYFRFDTRIAWKPTPQWEIAIVGQNLLDPLHTEFGNSNLREEATQIGRAVYGTVSVRF